MLRTILLVTIAVIAFAANSLLCRMALVNTGIDPTSFIVLRLVSGTITLIILSLLLHLRSNTMTTISSLLQSIKANTSLSTGIALFLYATCFSYAYITMSTGSGALLLFGSVQLTMITLGFIQGERFAFLQWTGFAIAFAGLITLLLPSASAPSILSSAMMTLAGMAWGVYSLLGKRSRSALLATTGNFIYASVLCIPLVIVVLFVFPLNLTLVNLSSTALWHHEGIVYALGSGIFASACGYAIWYTALPLIKSTTAATVQLSVPVIATLMGWLFLGESVSWQIAIASSMTLGGIYLVIMGKAR
ncbi:DMT family transporter [Alteromonas sp. D210916BOD_24]|uniref:DMT family transporter n=1 Tax=Alteromonas sp. D210916BOD_24 TaxID=3157618 RepID=UPI00399C6C93